MQVTQTNADGLKHEFKVVIPAGHLEEQIQTRLVEVGRNARIPGFRPGKVPMGLLRKKYGPSVMGEVVESAVNDATRHAMDEHKLRPALQPKIEITSFKEGGDLEFTVAVEALPDVAIMEFGGLTLEKPVAEVTDAILDEALQRIAAGREKTEEAPKKHAAKSGDVVVINFLGKLDGEPFDGGKAEGYSLKLGSNTFIPGFEDQLVGAKSGDDRVVKVNFPADYGADHLAGKEVEFEVKVTELRQPVPATVDDALAKELGLDDLEALKKAVKDEIERDYAGLSRAHVKRALLDQLATHHEFPVPQGMVDFEFDGIWKQLEQDREQGRLDTADQGKSDDDLKAEYRAIADRRVRLGLLLSEVARQNNITIAQEDLNRAVVAEARKFPGQEQLVFQYYQKNPDAMNNLKAPIFEEKVIDFILELAKVTEKKVSLEELQQDPEAAPAASAADEAKPKKRAAKKKATEA